MDFGHTPRMKEMQAKVRAFMDENVWPADAEYQRIVATHAYPEELIDRLGGFGQWTHGKNKTFCFRFRF